MAKGKKTETESELPILLEGPPLKNGNVRSRTFSTRRKSLLDADGKYIDPKTRKKRGPEPTNPRKKGFPRNERKASTVLLEKKKKTKAEKDAAKKNHAVTADQIEMMRKRNKILALREQGATIKLISQRMIAEGEQGCSEASVFTHLSRALSDLVENYTLNVKNFAQLRLNQMYRVELSHFQRLCDTSMTPDNFEKLSRGMDRIWKRMDDLIDQITGAGKTSTKVEIEHPAGGGTIETSIRVILPSLPEPDEQIAEEAEADAA